MKKTGQNVPSEKLRSKQQSLYILFGEYLQHRIQKQLNILAFGVIPVAQYIN